MRIFYSFLVILTATLLWMLPLTAAIYDFRTDVQEDTFASATGGVETTDNVTLSVELYDDDIQTIDILSSLATDIPAASSYNSTNRVLTVGGLSANTTRSLTISYDVSALVGNDAINTLADRLPWIWMLCIVGFAPASLAAIFTGRAG